nr:glycan-binding surface protein [uncultured Carboxylicivirga sp.]
MKKKLYSNMLLILMGLIAFTSCEDIVTYNDGYDDGTKSYGPPEITKITTVGDSSVVIDQADFADVISIYGVNLSQVVSITFNDVQVDLDEIFARNSRIVLPVPRQVPDEIDNTLTIITELGNTSTEFVVEVPPLIVDGLYNEFATAGDEVEVIGKNFDLYGVTVDDAVVEINGQEIEVLDATETGLKFVIPEQTADNTSIYISSPKVETPIEVQFRNAGYRILYFDSENGGMWSGFEYLTDGSNDGDPLPLYGVSPYSRVLGNFEAWSWSVPFGGGFNLDDEDIVSNPGDYWVKFEMLTKSNKALSIGNLIVGEKSWNPAEGGLAFNTYNNWKTITFDLVEVISAPAIGWNGWAFVFQPSDNIDADFSFCNMRIVKK